MQESVITRAAQRLQRYLCLFALAALTPPAALAQATELQALQSVGRLLVPAVRYKNGYAQHFAENCSATLVTSVAGADTSRHVLSAWHCIEDYRNLSRALVFESSRGQRSEAHILVSGGGMHSDWVLLRLQDSMPGGAYISPKTTVISNANLLMAGFPRNPQPEDGSDKANKTPQKTPPLQTSRHCKITGALGPDPRSDCVLRKGASGGGVFAATQSYTYLGVISQGDQLSQSIYVPVARFRENITSYLAADERHPGRKPKYSGGSEESPAERRR